MKKTIAMLLALVMVFALCACGGSSAPAATQAPAAETPAEAPAAAPGTGGPPWRPPLARLAPLLHAPSASST